VCAVQWQTRFALAHSPRVRGRKEGSARSAPRREADSRACFCWQFSEEGTEWRWPTFEQPEKRPRVQPDRSFPPGEASDKAQAKSKHGAAKHGAAGKSSASRCRKRGRQSHDSDINSDEECDKEEQRQLKLALEASKREASKREASGGSRTRRCTRPSDDHYDDEFKQAVKASLSNDVVVSDHVNLVEGMP
jgi:hypothetical protein